MRRAVVVVVLFACGQLDPSTPPTSTTYTFAMHDLFIDVARGTTGWPAHDAWKNYGDDIDGKVTDATSTDVCSNQVDGVNGIDNAFGQELVAAIEPEWGSFSDQWSGALQHGSWTLQIQITGLSDDPQQTSSGLVAHVFASDSYGATPAFDETTDWPILSSPVATFSNARVDHGLFDSGIGELPLVMNFQGVPMPLLLHHARFTFVHASREDALDGTISGVLDLLEFTDTMRMIAGRISPSLCGTAFDGVAAEYRAAADILKDGSNAPGVPCDGISFGIGFDAKLVANPTTIVEATPLGDPCAN